MLNVSVTMVSLWERGDTMVTGMAAAVLGFFSLLPRLKWGLPGYCLDLYWEAVSTGSIER